MYVYYMDAKRTRLVSVLQNMNVPFYLVKEFQSSVSCNSIIENCKKSNFVGRRIYKCIVFFKQAKFYGIRCVPNSYFNQERFWIVYIGTRQYVICKSDYIRFVLFLFTLHTIFCVYVWLTNYTLLIIGRVNYHYTYTLVVWC